MNAFVQTLISFGDSTQAIAALLAGTAFLALTRNMKAAAILFLAVVGAGGAIGTLKTVFIGCDLYLSDLDIRFPSGHAALSTAGLGTFCVLVASHLSKWKRWTVFAGFLAVEAAISTILVVMGFHTFYEVILGLFIGGCAVAGAFWAVRVTVPSAINLKGLVASMATVAVLIHVAEIPSRDMASLLAVVMHDQTSVCRPADHMASRYSSDRLSPMAQAQAQLEMQTTAVDAVDLDPLEPFSVESSD